MYRKPRQPSQPSGHQWPSPAELTRRTDAFRIAAEAIEHICAAEGLYLDAPTVDAAIRTRLATVVAATGITERTALGYVAPETLAVHLPPH